MALNNEEAHGVYLKGWSWCVSIGTLRTIVYLGKMRWFLSYLVKPANSIRYIFINWQDEKKKHVGKWGDCNYPSFSLQVLTETTDRSNDDSKFQMGRAIRWLWIKSRRLERPWFISNNSPSAWLNLLRKTTENLRQDWESWSEIRTRNLSNKETQCKPVHSVRTRKRTVIHWFILSVIIFKQNEGGRKRKNKRKKEMEKDLSKLKVLYK
jgi:hypothetical protein